MPQVARERTTSCATQRAIVARPVNVSDRAVWLNAFDLFFRGRRFLNVNFLIKKRKISATSNPVHVMVCYDAIINVFFKEVKNGAPFSIS